MAHVLCCGCSWGYGYGGVTGSGLCMRLFALIVTIAIVLLIAYAAKER